MFIDLHAHAYRQPYPGPDGKPVFSTPQQLIERYDELGVDKGCLMPIVNPEVYLPQSNEEILEIARTYPHRFIPFCNIDPRAVSNSSDAEPAFYGSSRVEPLRACPARPNAPHIRYIHSNRLRIRAL